MLALITTIAAASLPQLSELTHLPRLMALADESPAALAAEMARDFHATVANDIGEWQAGRDGQQRNAAVPVVVAHGMGDSCFNGGMKSVTAAIGKKLNAYATCKPTGASWITDTINGFLLNMDKSVDEFAKRVKNDTKLAGGFNALGLSQGNNLIRGYIQKYNDPPVLSFISM